MRIDEGQTIAYSEASRETELAVSDLSKPDYNRAVTIPEQILAKGGMIQRSELPFSVMVRHFMANSRLVRTLVAVRRAVISGHRGFRSSCGGD